MEMLISTKGNVIPAKQSNGTAPVSVDSPETMVAKVVGLAQFTPKGYPATVRLVCEADGKKYKVSSWEQCEPEAKVHLYREEGVIKGEKSDTTIYWYVATNQPRKGE